MYQMSKIVVTAKSGGSKLYASAKKFYINARVGVCPCFCETELSVTLRPLTSPVSVMLTPVYTTPVNAYE